MTEAIFELITNKQIADNIIVHQVIRQLLTVICQQTQSLAVIKHRFNYISGTKLKDALEEHEKRMALEGSYLNVS